MPLEQHEREEIDRLWKQANASAANIAEHEIKLQVWIDRVERMSRDASEASGKVSAQLDAMSANLLQLMHSVIELQTQGKTKGGLLDRYLPIAVALIAAAIAFFKP